MSVTHDFVMTGSVQTATLADWRQVGMALVTGRVLTGKTAQDSAGDVSVVIAKKCMDLLNSTNSHVHPPQRLVPKQETTIASIQKLPPALQPPSSRDY